MAELKVTVVMPALNEDRNVRDAVRSTLQAFDALGIAGELIVVNDGSTDATGQIVSDEIDRDARVRVLRHELPRGVGASFWDGVAIARGELVCMLPGDNENDPGETLRYLGVLEHVDIVVPFVFNRQVRSAFRNRLSSTYRFIVNTTFRVHFNYTNGTVIYRREVLDEVDFHCGDFFYQTDLLIRLVKRGYLYAEVPYRLNVRGHGKSKAVSVRSLMRVVRGYARLFKDVYFGAAARRARPFSPGSQTAKRRTE